MLDFVLSYLVPNRSVDIVSDVFEGLGEKQHRNAVLEFPAYTMRLRSQYKYEILYCKMDSASRN
jgi:hypothetical protein